MPDHDPFQSLWTQQTAEPFTMSMSEIHARASRFRSTIRTRNLTEYAAAALVLGVFGWMAWLIPQPVVKAGAILIMLGTAYVVHALHRRGGTGKTLPDGMHPLADYHRGELVKQRDALASIWRWYLLPFVPGMLVFVGGVSFAPETGLPLVARLIQFGTATGFAIAVFASVYWLNMRGAKQLDAEIAALDEARRG
ncbi:MAG: hypothetical protein R3C08_12250 [Hyphomonas sp.]